MKNIISSFVREFIKVIIIVAIAVPTIALFAWSGPTGAPPTKNADAPVNVGPLDQIKTGGWLSLGNLISRGTTLLARDGGNVGIGIGEEDGESPQTKLHVAGGDALFEGRVQIQGGLPEKGKVLVAADNTGLATWGNVTADMLIPQGYEEVFFNAGEDVYGNAVFNSRARDTCGGVEGGNNPIPIPTGQYECKVDENRVCDDAFFSACLFEINGQCRDGVGGGQSMSRNVECRAAKILRKNEWKYETFTYTGKAVVTSIDDDHSDEYGWADITIDGLCSRTNVRSADINEYSNSKFRDDWLFGAVKRGEICDLPFNQNSISNFTAEWDMRVINDPEYNVNGSGALKFVFTIIK